jgi:hypothetical protein
VAFRKRVDELQRQTDGAHAAVGNALERLAAIREVLMRSTVAGAVLDDEAYALERRLQEMRERLTGNRQRGSFGDPGPVSILRRLEVADWGTTYSTYGPTPTHREAAEIAERQFADLRRDLDRVLESELPAFEGRLDAAGVPWTPGRGVPE